VIGNVWSLGSGKEVGFSTSPKPTWETLRGKTRELNEALYVGTLNQEAA